MTIIKYSTATCLKYKLVIALECKEESILKKVAHFIMCVHNYPPFSSFQVLWWLCYLGVIFTIFYTQLEIHMLVEVHMQMVFLGLSGSHA